VAKKKKKTTSRPKNQELPGVNRSIGKLEQLAETYQEHAEEKLTTKSAIMAEMRRLKLPHYKHGKFELTMTPGVESVRVKVGKDPVEEE
jgi:hypothetical protein